MKASVVDDGVGFEKKLCETETLAGWMDGWMDGRMLDCLILLLVLLLILLLHFPPMFFLFLARLG